MKYLFFLLTLLNVSSLYAHNNSPKKCHCVQKNNKPSFFHEIAARAQQIWSEGNNELYVPSYAWHNRYTYSSERLKTYNEWPIGAGIGKSFYDKNGDWHGLYAMAFLDSHKIVEPAAGYAFLKILKVSEHANIGAGYTVLITARPDIFHNIPFPGVLPWASVSYRRVSLSGTYIPGAKGAGNVLFLVLKYVF